MDNSAFYKICHEKERIAYLLLEYSILEEASCIQKRQKNISNSNDPYVSLTLLHVGRNVCWLCIQRIDFTIWEIYTVILGRMKMTMKWSTQNQSKTIFLQKYTTNVLLWKNRKECTILKLFCHQTSAIKQKEFQNRTERSLLQVFTLHLWFNRRASERCLDQSLVDVILDEVNTRAKCSKIGESLCYKTLQ